MKGDEGLISGDDGGEGKDQYEAQGYGFEGLEEGVRAGVVLDGVGEGENGEEPAHAEEDRGNFKADISCGGRGGEKGLFGGALVLDGCPGAWDDHEEVLP